MSISARTSARLLLAAAAIVAACGRGDRPDHGAALPDVRIGTFTSRALTALPGLLSAEPLVAASWEGRPLFRLAESVTEAPDGSSLTFHLRPNVKFHSGEPVTSDRVRELLLRYQSLRDQVTAIETAGDGALVLRLKRPYGLKIADMAHYTLDDPERRELRTGPFKVTSIGSTAVLEPFKDYYQGAPTVARVEVRQFATHRAAWTAMMRGEVNFLHEVNRDAIQFIEAGGNTRVYPTLRPYVVPLVFNTRHPVLRMREVRVALNEAVDRDEVVKNGMRGHGQPAEGPFWPHHWAYPRAYPSAPHNPEAAKLRLDGAGLPMRQRGRDEAPTRFGFTCMLVEHDARFERIALVVQRQLFAVGVDMELRVVTLDEFRNRVAAMDYDAFISEMANGRTLIFPYQFWHSRASQLPTGYSAADEALERMKLARSDDETRVAVLDVMRIMRADPPAVFLANPREARAADKAFEFAYEPDRDIFGTLWQMKRASLRAERTP